METACGMILAWSFYCLYICGFLQPPHGFWEFSTCPPNNFFYVFPIVYWKIITCNYQVQDDDVTATQ